MRRDQAKVQIVIATDGVTIQMQAASTALPNNLVDQIPEPDFYNLLAYLLSQRVTKEARTER